MSEKNSKLKDPREWVKDLDIESTEDIAVPKMLVDQVIGQKQGVEIVRKAAEQKRHVMLIGDPGTGNIASFTAATPGGPDNIANIQVTPTVNATGCSGSPETF